MKKIYIYIHLYEPIIDFNTSNFVLSSYSIYFFTFGSFRNSL